MLLSRKVIIAAAAATGILLSGCAATTAGSSSSASEKTITIASPQCAHCLAMALLPDQIKGYKVEYQNFSKLSDLEAGLASGRIDVGQIDYTGLVAVISQGLPIIAISGEVNGGSDLLVSPSLKVKTGDWASFKSLVVSRKVDGKPLTIASQFGSVQDIELRLELPKEGVKVSDVNIVNTTYEGMAQALHSGSVDAAAAVQPFAAAIIEGGFGKHFDFPYDQAAGNLTNVVVVSQRYAKDDPAAVAAITKGMVGLVAHLKTKSGKAEWSKVVQKYTNTSAPVVESALSQLTPDLKIPMSQVKAIAASMYSQGLLSKPVSDAQLSANIDYAPLAKATGKSAAELGSE
jgi:ABC-type nitrate/sulfonate/bicarbonate transport system substrate-binding protein